MYILLNDYHSKLASSPHIVAVFFLVMRMFKIYSQQLANIPCSVVNYSHHAVHYIPRTYVSFNCKFVPFDWKFVPFGHCLTANMRYG